jgi:hypothetical protein
LTVQRLVQRILVSRTEVDFVRLEDHGRDRSSEAWDRDRWELEVERFLAERQEEKGALSSARDRMPKRWLRGLPLRPPAYPQSFFSAEAPEHPARTARIAALLRGDDAALAVWLVEMLRRSPDGALDGLLAHASSAEATRVRLFRSEHDPVTRAAGFTLGHIVRMLLAERVEDGVLGYNVRHYDDACLAVEVETAWVEHRGRGHSLDPPGGAPGG